MKASIPFETLTNLFVRGAAFSRQDEKLFLVEANHKLFTLAAMPEENGVFLRIHGSINLEQAQIVSIQAHPPVKFIKPLDHGEVQWCQRRYNLFTSLGTVEITITSDEVADLDKLALELFETTGYPPEDAKRLEDFE